MKLHKTIAALSLTICLLASSVALGGVLMTPVDAPEWQVSEWINGDAGRVSKYQQKVLVIHFFQMWCPGCNDFTIPLMEKWQNQFAEYPEFKIVSIHSVFEGHAQQTPDLLRTFIAEKGITHPVGIDAYENGSLLPVTMSRFDTGGSPHVVVIDRRSQIRFSHFGRFDPEPVENFIKRILDEEKMNILSMPRDALRDKLKDDRKKRQGNRKKRDVKPVDAEPEKKTEEEPPGRPDAELSGSYKLRFEPLSRSCGDVGKAIEVITQLSAFEDRIVAKFSRPFLGVRQLEAEFDSGSNDFRAETTTKGTEKGGVQVDLRVQVSGRYLSIADPPEIEYDYYIEQTSDDGRCDCVIEGRGGGTRFRAR
jgi:hypothetical protein